MNKLIGEYLTKLGFSEGAARLYEVLVEKGPLTILEASRATEIERTALYRLIDDLTARGLIEEVLEHKSRHLQAVPPHKIKYIVDSEKQRVEKLENEFPEFESLIGSLPQNNSTQVRYYRGIAGIKQILWNETRAKGQAVGYTHRNLEEVVGNEYFALYARTIEKNMINFRDLRTDSFLQSTKAEDYIANPIKTGFWRYLPDRVLHLTHNMDIYNDVVAIYYWENNDVFGIEIQNKLIADTQRSIFETLWNLAKTHELPQQFSSEIDLNNFSHLVQNTKEFD